MSLELFRVNLGLDIESVDGLTNANVLHGNGAPGGDASLQDNAPIGSLYMRNDIEVNDLQLYYKYRTTQNSTADWQQVVSREFLNSVINGISWREPARVLDTTTYADVPSLPITGTIDGVTLADGDRVLFSDITTGNNNVYIWDQGGTSWTESANSATDGDTVLIQEGTSAEQQWTFDSTNWVQTGGSANTNELGFIRSFIGKDGIGVETPTYNSSFVITQNNSLEATIGELDLHIGNPVYTEQNFIDNNDTISESLDGLDIQIGSGDYLSTNIVDDAQDITENISDLDAIIGNGNYTNTANHVLSIDNETITASLEKINLAIGDRNYTNGFNIVNGETVTQTFDKIDIALGDPNHSSTNVISNAASINDNLSSLDLSIGNRTYTNDNVVTDGETLTLSIDAIDSQLGNNTYTESNIVSNANNITENLDAIDVVVNSNFEQSKIVKTAGVNSQTTVDSLPVADAVVAKWIVLVENDSDSTNRESLEVHALHNGTIANFDRYSIRRFGPNITGLDIDIDINAGSLRLLVTTGITTNVAVKRLGYFTV